MSILGSLFKPAFKLPIASTEKQSQYFTAATEAQYFKELDILYQKHMADLKCSHIGIIHFRDKYGQPAYFRKAIIIRCSNPVIKDTHVCDEHQKESDNKDSRVKTLPLIKKQLKRFPREHRQLVRP